MHTQTHILTGWCLANTLDLTPRERLFGTLAASLADLDSLSMLGGRDCYWTWHHVLSHNLTVCLAATALMVAFSTHRLKVLLMSLGLFHLHLFMDYWGSGECWGFYYLWPFSRRLVENPEPWAFYSWQNLGLGAALLAWTLWIAAAKARTPLEVLMPSLDRQLAALAQRLRPAPHRRS